MNNLKDKLNKILNQKYMESLQPLRMPKVQGGTNQDISNPQGFLEEEEPSSDLKTHRTFMGELSELIFPLCVTDYFITNKTTSEDIFNAIEHINLTKEKKFVLFDSEVSETSSLFLSKNEDMKARILASRQEKVTKSKTPEISIKEYSEVKSEEFFKSLNIDSEVNAIKNKVLQHFIPFKDSDETKNFKFEGKEEVNGYSITYLAHLYRSKQHASTGQKESDAIKWYKERSNGIVNELGKPEVAFADTKVIKQGRGGISVALRFIIVPQITINEDTTPNKVAFAMEDSSDSLRIALSVEYSDNFLSDLTSIISNSQHDKFQEVINMIETYLENLQDVPEIIEARQYLEYLTSNGEIDFIDLTIRSSGSMGAHEGGLSGNIKKDADIKIVEFDAMSRKGIKETKVFNFSLKASDRKDVGIIQFNEKWKNELMWVFELCDLDFKKLNWDKFAPSGDSESIMKNMKDYFISIQSSSNEKLVRFMFSILDLFAHGHEDSTLISISQSRKDIKVYSTLISEYIRARKIYVSVLDMNDPASVATYYARVEKRTGAAKRGRKPSQDIQQFLLQLTDESNDSFGVIRFIQGQSRRSGAKFDEAVGRPVSKIIFNPYKISIDDELDNLCSKLSNDLKDETKRKLWSINRVVRRVFLLDKLITKNLDNPKLLNQYKEIIESFESVLRYYSTMPLLQIVKIDYALINTMKAQNNFNLSEYYNGPYESIKGYMLDNKEMENEEQLSKFYGTVLAYSLQKCAALLKQIPLNSQ